jgi:hypothetical protein
VSYHWSSTPRSRVRRRSALDRGLRRLARRPASDVKWVPLGVGCVAWAAGIPSSPDYLIAQRDDRSVADLVVGCLFRGQSPGTSRATNESCSPQVWLSRACCWYGTHPRPARDAHPWSAVPPAPMRRGPCSATSPSRTDSVLNPHYSDSKTNRLAAKGCCPHLCGFSDPCPAPQCIGKSFP